MLKEKYYYKESQIVVHIKIAQCPYSAFFAFCYVYNILDLNTKWLKLSQMLKYIYGNIIKKIRYVFYKIWSEYLFVICILWPQMETWVKYFNCTYFSFVDYCYL